jgi:hypothetical protein
LAEIDENLIRRDLTAAQRAKLIAKRKATYEAVHGPAKAVGGRASAAKQEKAVAAAKLADASFTRDTAAKTGKPERTIQRDATRAKALGNDLDRVTGTSLDKGAELDACQELLARPPPGALARELAVSLSGKERPRPKRSRPQVKGRGRAVRDGDEARALTIKRAATSLVHRCRPPTRQA